MNLSDFSIVDEVARYCREHEIPQPSNCWGSLEDYDKQITFVWAVDGFPELIVYYEITAYSPTWVFFAARPSQA